MALRSVLAHVGPVRWPTLWVGAFITLTLGLSAHVLMMTVLHVPFPYGQPKVSLLRFLNDVAITLAALLIYHLSPISTSRIHPVAKVGLLFALLTMIAEVLLRGPLMSGFVTTAWLYAFIENVPKLAPWLAATCLVVCGAPFTTTWGRRLLFAVVAGGVFLAVGQIADRLYAPVIAAAALLQHDAVYGFPYGWQVTTAAYITYVEPVGACLVAAALIWSRLTGGTGPKIAAVALLIVMVRGSLLGPFTYATYHSDHWLAAFVSDGQFAFESLVLGLLTAVNWRLSSGPRLGRSSLATSRDRTSGRDA